jgi:hypothetical protein
VKQQLVLMLAVLSRGICSQMYRPRHATALARCASPLREDGTSQCTVVAAVCAASDRLIKASYSIQE